MDTEHPAQRAKPWETENATINEYLAAVGWLMIDEKMQQGMTCLFRDEITPQGPAHIGTVTAFNIPNNVVPHMMIQAILIFLSNPNVQIDRDMLVMLIKGTEFLKQSIRDRIAAIDSRG